MFHFRHCFHDMPASTFKIRNKERYMKKDQYEFSNKDGYTRVKIVTRQECCICHKQRWGKAEEEHPARVSKYPDISEFNSDKDLINKVVSLKGAG